MACSEIRDILSSDRNCQKLQEVARNCRNLKKVIDFVVFPGIDGFRSFFEFCSKLPEIARNCPDLQKAIDFVGFPGIDGFRSIFPILIGTARNCPKLPAVARNLKNLRKVIDFVGFPGIDWFRSFFLILLETARNRQKLSEIWRRGRFLEGFPYKIDHLFQFRHFEFCQMWQVSVVPPNTYFKIAPKPRLRSRNKFSVILRKPKCIEISFEMPIGWLEISELRYVTTTYMSRLEITHCICKLTYRPREMPPCYRKSKNGQPWHISSSRILQKLHKANDTHT